MIHRLSLDQWQAAERGRQEKWLRSQKTSDTKYQYANILIFGESGSGKTHF